MHVIVITLYINLTHGRGRDLGHGSRGGRNIIECHLY